MVTVGVDKKYIDTLTRTFTKDYFFIQARKKLDENPDTDFCIVELDVNRLTMINDMYGLVEGDRVLKTIADSLIKIFEEIPNSLVARVHADLFVFMCPFSKEEVEGYIETIESDARFLSQRLSVDLLLSFGIYVTNDKSVPISSMCERANLALKTIKGNYINHIAYFDDEMRARAIEELEITTKMNTALKNREFVVYFQPKHSLDTEEVIGAEALVRWISPTKGIISPAKFIPIFENNGFIMKLDEYVWEETCKFISEKLAEGVKVPPISVNVSRVDLYNPKLVETIVGLVKKYDINPKMLKLEFTESAYTESMQQMLVVMDKIHESGMEIDMDDFGSGYSGLNVLKDCPVDGLKIDLKFLSKSNNEVKSKKILSSVIHMAKWLGIPSIVEGVETESQVNHLKSLGCTMVQGYYFAKPMPMNEFIEYLNNHKVSSVIETVKPFDEIVLNPDDWFEAVTADCEPILEMCHSYMIFNRGSDLELDVLRASDNYYASMGGREKQYMSNISGCDIIHKDDLKKVLDTFDSIDDYHSIGKCLYRIVFNDQVAWVYLRVRLLEKYEEHKVFFATMDDVTEVVNGIK